MVLQKSFYYYTTRRPPVLMRIQNFIRASVSESLPCTSAVNVGGTGISRDYSPERQAIEFGSGRTGGDRTRDPNIKSVVLYQLSYSPRMKTAHSIHDSRPIGN